MTVHIKPPPTGAVDNFSLRSKCCMKLFAGSCIKSNESIMCFYFTEFHIQKYVFEYVMLMLLLLLVQNSI